MMSESTLMLWKWLHVNPKIIEPFILDAFLGLGTRVTRHGEVQVTFNGVKVEAIVFLPNSEVSRDIFMEEYANGNTFAG